MTATAECTVHEVLAARSRDGSTRRTRKDQHHLALVVEGGGMRGVVAGGMVSGLEEFDLLHCFDTIHGSSAGACAGAYFMASQATLGTSIYYEDINNKQFIDVKRGAMLQPIMSTTFLIDHVMRHIKVLDVERILEQPGFLHMVITDAETAAPYIVTSFEDADDFFKLLKASISIPLIAGKWVTAKGRRLVDGGMTQQIALDSALAAGATHVLVLMTHREQDLIRPPDAKFDPVSYLFRGVYGHKLAACYAERHARINATVQKVLSGRHGNVLIDGIARPPKSGVIDRLCTDAALLIEGDRDARQSIRDYMASGSRVRTAVAG